MGRLSTSELTSPQNPVCAVGSRGSSATSSVGRRESATTSSSGRRESAQSGLRCGSEGSRRGGSVSLASIEGSLWRNESPARRPQFTTPVSKPSSRLVINHVSVYIPDGDGWRDRLLQSAAKLLMDPRFDTAMGIVIVANSVTIGFELSFRLENRDTSVIEDLEHFFLAVYFLELALRGYVMRLKCFKDRSVLFDILLVFSGVLITWVLRPLKLHNIEGGIAPGMLAVLRTLRLLRLARTVRLLVKFRELWMLVRSLMNSASTMAYTCILMTIILYILACMGVELVSLNERATDPEPDALFLAIVDEHFRTVALTMVTLVQFVCLDSIAGIYKPLIELEPFLAVYFMGSILVVGIVLMNLITAVVVNSAMEQATQDKEAMAVHENRLKEKLLKDLRKLFLRLDEDSSGQVSREEITQGITEEDREMLENVLHISDPVEVFDALDVDDSGELDIDEFCAGIWQVAMSKTPIEIKRIEKQLNFSRDQLRGLASSVTSIKQKLTALEAMMKRREGETKARGGGATVKVVETKAHTDNTPSIAGFVEAKAETKAPGSVPLAGDGPPDHVQLPPGGLLDQLAFLIRRAVRDEFVLLSESAADAHSALPRLEKLGVAAARGAAASRADLLPPTRCPHWNAPPPLPASPLEGFAAGRGIFQSSDFCCPAVPPEPALTAPPPRLGERRREGAATPPSIEAPDWPTTPPDASEPPEPIETLETWLTDEINNTMADLFLDPISV